MWFSVLLSSICALAAAVHGGMNYSTSGLSSGGFFTVQLGIAFSSEVIGVGVVAGGPYYCAKDSETTALTACMSIPAQINVNSLVTFTKSAADAGNIDDTANIAKQRIYLYSGTMDFTVQTGVVTDCEKYYKDFGATTNMDTSQTSAHGMVTDFYGNKCSIQGEPYIQNCNYDLAGKILQFIYMDELKPPVAHSDVPYNHVVAIPQTQFIPLGSTPASISVETVAYAYIASTCRISPMPTHCLLHVVFHGCEQDLSSKINFNTAFNDTYVRDTGYNEWAESNAMVILYPQANIKAITNPNGCWDWWGYNTKDYAYKTGKQMAMTHNMIQYILTGSAKWITHTHANS